VDGADNDGTMMSDGDYESMYEEEDDGASFIDSPRRLKANCDEEQDKFARPFRLQGIEVNQNNESPSSPTSGEARACF